MNKIRVAIIGLGRLGRKCVDAIVSDLSTEDAGTARMMLAAARSLPFLKAGAYSLLDLPPGALWGEQRPVAEKE